MLFDLFLITTSLGLLTLGAEGLVRGSASMALRLGLTPLMVGLTVVAFGTSAPELIVSLKASQLGQGDIALGNVIGSNIFNIGVILGLTALICPVPVKLQIIKIDGPIMLGVALLVPLLLLDGNLISRLEGIALTSGIAGYTALLVFLARREPAPAWQVEFEEGMPRRSRHWLLDLLLMVAGLALLIAGSRLLVDSSVSVARILGVSEAVIGLTIVAAGTSVPELATSVVAAIRKEPDIAVGNIIGSNIFNILAILGVSATVMPISASGIRSFDILVMIGFSILLLPVIRSGSRLSRIEGGILLAGYVAYLILLWPN